MDKIREEYEKVVKLSDKEWQIFFSRIEMFTFSKKEVWQKMIPAFIPFKEETMFVTGIVEVAAAVGLHVKKYRALTAWLLILFFISILPANIKAAIDQLDYKTGLYNGNGPIYLLFRIPLQILFIAWTYLSSIKTEGKSFLQNKITLKPAKQL